MKSLIQPIAMLVFSILLFTNCSDDKEEVDAALPDGVKELGEAPNDMEIGSAEWEGVKMPSQSNGTTCLEGSGENENNSYWINVSSTVSYKGKPRATKMMVILPDSGLVSGVYSAVNTDPMDFNQVNSVSVWMSIQPDFGYSSGGEVWVKYENGEIEVRFSDLPMNDKADGSGSTIATLSGAAKCKKD